MPRTSPPAQAPRADALRLTAAERRLLVELTSLPTAAGREDAVQRAIDLWAASLDGAVRVRRDRVGNVLVTATGAERRSAGGRRRGTSRAPRLLVTAHLDHPAFVVRRAVSATELELEFRGGVHDPYFEKALLEVFDAAAPQRPAFTARITALDAKAKPFKRVRAVVRRADRATVDARRVPAGSIARWKLPPAEIRDGLLRTHACDDLAAVACAMIAFERRLRGESIDGPVAPRRGGSRRRHAPAQDPSATGLLFTVAEEVGFLGAIHAAGSGIIPRGATLLCLENSRSFPHDSPIGAGAILRVGDRLSVFTPRVTNGLTQLFQAHAAKHPDFRWQRKLMPGGACEATAFASLGHSSTCLCLPLGNYHNMRDIDGVLAGRRPARVDREFVALADVESLVSMLLLAADHHGSDGFDGDFRPLMERLRREKSRQVLGRSLRRSGESRHGA